MCGNSLRDCEHDFSDLDFFYTVFLQIEKRKALISSSFDWYLVCPFFKIKMIAKYARTCQIILQRFREGKQYGKNFVFFSRRTLDSTD